MYIVKMNWLYNCLTRNRDTRITFVNHVLFFFFDFFSGNEQNTTECVFEGKQNDMNRDRMLTSLMILSTVFAVIVVAYVILHIKDKTSLEALTERV